MQFYKKFLRLILVLSIGIFILSGCGGGSTGNGKKDGGNNGNGVSNSNPNKKTSIDLNTKSLNIKNLNNYKITTRNKATSVKDNNITFKKNERAVVALVNDTDIPILFGIKYPGKEKAELSLDSSAEVFVLYSPIFNGTQSSNPIELSKRIRNHKDFPKLKDAIKKAINNGNPCPLDPICNYQAKNIALRISNEIKIDDLYQNGGK